MHHSNPFTHGKCLVCDSPFVVHLRDVGTSRTRRIVPLLYCLHCKSFTCVGEYQEDEGQLISDVQFNVDLIDQKTIAFGRLVEYLGGKSECVIGKPVGELSYADIGCNIGVLVNSAAGFKSSAGYDLNRFAIERGRQLFPRANLNCLPFGNDGLSYDCVTLVDVMEHIHAPRPFFAEIISHVNPRGLVYITGPFLDENLWRFLTDSAESQQTFMPNSPFRDNDVHVIHFSSQGMIELGRSFGLKLIEDRTSKEWPLNGILFQKAPSKTLVRKNGTPLPPFPISDPSSKSAANGFPKKPVVNFFTIIKTAASEKIRQRVMENFSEAQSNSAQDARDNGSNDKTSAQFDCSSRHILAAIFELLSPKTCLEISGDRESATIAAVDPSKLGFTGKLSWMPAADLKLSPDLAAKTNDSASAEVIYINGGGRDENLRDDLENIAKYLLPEGFMILDDIVPPQRTTRLAMWKEFVAAHPELEDIVEIRHGYGWALARRRQQDSTAAPNGSVSADGFSDATAGKSAGGTMDVATQSDFARTLAQLIVERRPRRLIETGTHVGTGTTTIIASSLRNARLEGATFHSIEVNPQYYLRANANLRQAGLDRFVHLHNGLSLPRQLLPTSGEIQTAAAEAAKHTGIYVDHEEARRVSLYLAETDFENVEDDLLGRYLAEFEYKPDLLLLDSAGHLGFVEFQYVLQFIKGPCLIALDDVHHLKHYLTLQQIRNDARFKILAESKEKYGFCIAEFTPSKCGHGSAGRTNEAWIHQYLERVLAPRKNGMEVPADTLKDYEEWKKTFPAGAAPTDTRPIEALLKCYPKHGEFYTDLGVSLRAGGNRHTARRMFEQAVRLSPADARGWQELARHYYCDVGNVSLALALCRHALSQIRIQGRRQSILEESSGFLGWEDDYCWLNREASLVVHTNRLNFPAALEFTLTSGDAWCYGQRLLTSDISSEEKTLSHLIFTGNKHRETVVLPLPARTSPVPIKITSSAAFVPSKIDRNSKDSRQLSVCISGLAFRPQISPDSLDEDGLRKFIFGNLQ